MTAHSRKSVNMAMMFIQHGLLRQALKAARKGGKGLLLMNMLQSGSTPGGIPTGAATTTLDCRRIGALVVDETTV
jgi:hypothetical protein